MTDALFPEASSPWRADAEVLRQPLGRCFDTVPEGWRSVTEAFRHSPAGAALIDRVDARVAAGVPVHPAGVLAALTHTPRERVSVVILGQDPYHGPGQAHGLSFSVPPGQTIPPSLRNIRRELQRDLGLALPPHGCLSAWAAQGVLMLNTVLTVEEGLAASHAGWGWEALTDALLAAVVADGRPLVVMLWGAHAQRKRELVLTARSADRLPSLQLLQSNHPSPLSATRGPEPFVGHGHFGRARQFLSGQGVVLDWSLA